MSVLLGWAPSAHSAAELLKHNPCHRLITSKSRRKKQRHARFDESPEVGDQWVFVAMDAETKLVPTFVVGKRTEETTWYFMQDLAARVSSRIQLTRAD